MAPRYASTNASSSHKPILAGVHVQDATTPLEVLTIAAMIGSLACLLYIIVHLSFTKVYQTIKKLIRGADDDDPDDEPRVPRTKPRETKRLFAEKNAKGNHSDFSDDNFVMGHGKPKGTRYLREQINRGKSENVGPNTAGLEDEVAQCCKRSEQALGRASKRAYGTIYSTRV